MLSLGLATLTCSAAEPYFIPGSFVTGFTPDNTKAVSEYFGALVIYDLESGEFRAFEPNEDGTREYYAGVGNYLANNAICASQGTYTGASAFLWGKTGINNGRFVEISNDAIGGIGAANGVTADGTRFCGNTPTGIEFGIEAEGTMVVPCTWDRNGNTFTRTLLPAPTTDYAGLAPQYVTALSISDNGKTIIGQIVSNNGFLHEFVIYTQAEDGTWSYRRPFDSLVNPNKLTYPEYPGDEGPDYVTAENYMTEEEFAQYIAATEEYYAKFPNGNNPPAAVDYMTEEEKAAYLAALAVFKEWSDKYDAWVAVDEQIRQESIDFEMNLNSLSPNGRYMASSTVVTKFVGLERVSEHQPFLYDIVEDKVLVNGGPNIRVTSVNDNGDVLGFVRDMVLGDLGYVLLAGTTEWIPLEQYVVQRNPSLVQWVEDNWKHEVEVIIDYEEMITDFQTLYITGTPFISRDWSMLSTVFFPTWENTNPDIMSDWYNSCIMDLSEQTSINEVETLGNANAPVEYFNIQGIRVNEPQNGIFIRRQGSNVSKVRK